MPNRLAILLICLVFLDGCAGRQEARPGQFAKEFQTTQEVGMKYLLYLPESYFKNEEKQWPLILFLHGSGERGDDLELIKKHGPPSILENRKDFPFIVLSPQCPAVQWWDVGEVKLVLDDVIKTYRIDQSRIYATGLSMGGYGVWEMIIRCPDFFAAAAPIAGGGIPSHGRYISQLPVWVFHGKEDEAVPISESRNMVKYLKKNEGNVKFTVYPKAGHVETWQKAYEGSKLFDWFLDHQKGKNE